MEETTLADRWWVVALRGAAATTFGIITLLTPETSLFVLVVLFGAYALVDGAFNLVMITRQRGGGRRWGSLAFAGVASIVAGVLTFVWPGITALVLLMVIAAWLVVTGIASIVAAVRLRKEIKGEWLLALSGILSVALGVLMVIFPGAGALAVTIWIGAYALVTGVLLAVLGFRLRARRTASERPVGGPARAPA